MLFEIKWINRLQNDKKKHHTTSKSLKLTERYKAFGLYIITVIRMLKLCCGNYVLELVPTLLYVIPVNYYIIVAIRTRLFMVEAQGMT